MPATWTHDEEENSEDAATVQMGTEELAALLREPLLDDASENIADPPSLERPQVEPDQDVGSEVLRRFPRPGPRAAPAPEPEAPPTWMWASAALVMAGLGVAGLAYLAF